MTTEKLITKAREMYPGCTRIVLDCSWTKADGLSFGLIGWSPGDHGLPTLGCSAPDLEALALELIRTSKQLRAEREDYHFTR